MHYFYFPFDASWCTMQTNVRSGASNNLHIELRLVRMTPIHSSSNYLPISNFMLASHRVETASLLGQNSVLWQSYNIGSHSKQWKLGQNLWNCSSARTTKTLAKCLCNAEEPKMLTLSGSSLSWISDVGFLFKFVKSWNVYKNTWF